MYIKNTQAPDKGYRIIQVLFCFSLILIIYQKNLIEDGVNQFLQKISQYKVNYNSDLISHEMIKNSQFSLFNFFIKEKSYSFRDERVNLDLSNLIDN